jgi:diguanylate cyclase (GGDEF)-like protein
VSGNGAGETRRRGRVLVVDDQPVNLQLMAEVLRGSYDVLVATSGSRALEIASSGSADLILLDVEMPEMDGIEVCSRLKADPRTSAVPVLFVSARGEVQDEARGFDAGGVDYIIKPVNGPLVCARVRTHLELKIARDALEQMALVDGLTGIANRRRFDDALQSEWRRSGRGGRPLALILFDVDHFKRFNDSWGHVRGDECLRSVAAVLSEECGRAADVVARYGGEEFALILPDTTAAGAMDVVRRLLGRFAQLRISGCESKPPAEVSLSGGGVTLVPTLDGDPKEVLNLADHLLYQAKAAGRKRVLYRDLTDEGSPTDGIVIQV